MHIYRVLVEVYSDFFPGRKIIRAVPELFVLADGVNSADVIAQRVVLERFNGGEFDFVQIDRLDFTGAVGTFTTVWKRGR